MDFIDLRSDTVTQPTPEMRQAMAQAMVGDDVYGEDPTVNRLQGMAAAITGKEAGLFVPSGTMGNLAAILSHCTRGDEVILGNQAHTFIFEAGGVSALGGVHSYQVENQPDGTLKLEDIRAAIRDDNPHFPITRLIALENTHNRCGGVALGPEYGRAVGELARQFNLSLHLDGARLFNAAEAVGASPKELCAPFELSHLLPEQRSMCSSGVGLVRLTGVHPARSPGAQAARRRHASGRGPGGCRDHRSGNHARPTG